MNCKIFLCTEKKLELFSLFNTSVALKYEVLMLVDTSFHSWHATFSNFTLVRFREKKEKVTFNCWYMYLQNQIESRNQAADYWNFLRQMNSIDWWKKEFWLEVPLKQIVDWGLTRFSHCNNKRLTVHVIDSRNLKAISFLKMYGHRFYL